MKLPQDARFRDEAERFSLRFGCDDCAHFDAEGERCTHGYPVEEHRATPAAAPWVVFCKEFALR